MEVNVEQHISELGYTYRDIGDMILESLMEEREPMHDFLSDWDEYIMEMPYKRGEYIAVAKLSIENTPEFKELLRISHTLVLECQRSRYIETGIDFHLSMTIAEFLEEIFNRFLTTSLDKADLNAN